MLQRQPGRATIAVGLQPALHPGVAAFGLPDLGQLQDAATAGTFERVVAEGSFDTLAPFEVLEGLGQGFQVEEGGLEAKCVQGSVDERDKKGERAASSTCSSGWFPPPKSYEAATC